MSADHFIGPTNANITPNKTSTPYDEEVMEGLFSVIDAYNTVAKLYEKPKLLGHVDGSAPQAPYEGLDQATKQDIDEQKATLHDQLVDYAAFMLLDDNRSLTVEEQKKNRQELLSLIGERAILPNIGNGTPLRAFQREATERMWAIKRQQEIDKQQR